MANSVYKINKGINQPIEFKGLKAQFIWYLGGGLVGLLILFATMYFLQFNTYVSLAVIATAATALFMRVYKLSNTYGEHGMMKRVARRGVPHVLKLRSRKVFMQKNNDGKRAFNNIGRHAGGAGLYPWRQR